MPRSPQLGPDNGYRLRTSARARRRRLLPRAGATVDPTMPQRPQSSETGFTMLELIVVAGVLAVLMGVGFGYLRRSDGLAEARSSIGGALRLAALDARSRGMPTEVQIVAGEEGRPAQVLARGLDPVVLVTFEPGQHYADGQLDPQLGGVEYENGRCGRCRGPGGDAKTAAVRLPFGPTVADLRDGFAIRCDVLLRERLGGRLLRLGRAIDVQLDGSGRPLARVQARGPDGRGGQAVNLQSAAALPVGRWCTFEIGLDGHRVWMAIDGRECAGHALEQAVLQQKDDQLEVMPADEPLAGAVDELQVFAYAFAPTQYLPPTVVLQAPVRIAFDVLGEPIAPQPIKLEMLADGRIEQLTVGTGGVLQ